MRRKTSFALSIVVGLCGCSGGSFGPRGAPASGDDDDVSSGDAGTRPDAGGSRDASVPLRDAAALVDAETAPLDSGPDEIDSGPGTFRLEDPLRNGTVGNPIGGSFGDDGWTTTDRTDRIWYALPRLVEGSIEITMSNVSNDTLLPSDNEVLTMYEAGWGIPEPIRYSPEYRNNHYKCMIRIYGQLEDGRVGQQKMMWGMCPSGAPGYDECGCGSFFEEPFGGDGNWDGTPQRLRLEWRGGVTRFSRNGAEVVSVDWSGSGLTFGPQELHFTIGSPRSTAIDDNGMPIGAVFSDLVVEGTLGDEASCL